MDSIVGDMYDYLNVGSGLFWCGICLRSEKGWHQRAQVR